MVATRKPARQVRATSHAVTTDRKVAVTATGKNSMFFRIIFALLVLVKVRLPEEKAEADRTQVKKAIDHLLIGKWCHDQAERTPQHEEELTAAAEDEFETAIQIMQKLNAKKTSGTSGKPAGQPVHVNTSGPGSENFYG